VAVVVLKVTSGYSPEYLLKEVATGRESYYTGAVAEGEPPGRWWGAGAEKLGLTGLVDAQDMTGLFERFLDPRHEAFRDPSRWEEVSTLGHTGRKYLSEDELYALALEREPDASPERRAELRTEAGRNARHNVAFFDVTFNAQKSVTLIHTAFEAQEVAARNAGDEEAAAAWGRFRRSVEDAVWAGNNAGLAYMAEKAGYSRVGHHGGAAGRWVDAHDWTVASFFQHDSREHDPHLHIHNAFLNRVQGPDGAWRTVDSKALFKFRPAAAAVAERTTEERLTHALGLLVATRPDGKAREVVGVSQEAMDLISTRRRKVTAKAEELIEAFEQRHGRAPNGLERDRLAQQATLMTRAAKSHTGETREQLLDRIDARIRADINGGLAGVAHSALAARGQAPALMEWSPQAVIELALAEVQSRKAGWNRADLTGAINAALPDYLGLPDGADVARLLDSLTDEALRYATVLDEARPGDEYLPPELRLANGESAYQAPGARLYATPEQVRTERALVAATADRTATALPWPVAQRFLTGLAESGIELGADQAAAVRGVLTSGACVESLVGPAGTGKSFVVGAIARGWTDPALTGGEVPRRVFGLATSQIATDVLAAEGLSARNVARWVATQHRLAAGGGEGGPGPVEQDVAWRLHAGDLVVVDESAMTDTAALAEVHRHVERAGAKLLLVGDHRQLAAVGAGGGMDLLAQAGGRYELAEARRFREGWEREASLRLRAGDDTVLRDYHRHGRLLDSGTREQAEASAARAWLADTLAGRRSLLLVDSNDQAARLSAELRAELVRLGRVAEQGVRLGLQGTVAGVGDLVQARWNGWDLAGYEGNQRGPINRETYQVLAVRDDGGLEVAPLAGSASAGRADVELGGETVGERMVLPAPYVAEHLALAYAATVHSAQGQTVDSSHAVITSRTSAAALYVGMSRGREANTAHVATTSAVEDPAQGGAAHQLHRDPTAVLAGLLDARDPITTQSALALAAGSAAETASVRTPAELLADAAQLAATERTASWLDRLAGDGVLSLADRARISAEDGAVSLTRVLRRAELAGHDPYGTLVDAVADRPLDGVRNVTNVIYSRIAGEHRFEPVGQSWAEWAPKVDDPAWQTYLDTLAAAADQRTAELGAQAAAEPPAWTVEAFGPVPDDGPAREDWRRRVGVVAAYRELRGQDHDDHAADGLGRAPKPGQVQQYAAYRAAWRELGRPDVDRAAHELSDGQLRMRMRAWEREQAFGPRYVANELAGTRQAADTQRQTAALRQAEADATTDAGERARPRQEAEQAAALATTLDARAEQLQQIDDARAHWLAHTSETRVNAEQAQFVIAERHADDEPDQLVTAQEWLAAAKEADAAEDPHREITDDADLADVQAERDAATSAADDSSAAASAVDDESDDREAVLETAVEDIRDIAAREPKQRDEDIVRVPTAEEAAAGLDHAWRALHEIHARQAEEERESAEQRAEQLAHWHADDATTVAEDGAENAAADDLAGDEPVLEHAPPGQAPSW
jgi:hypothetical protein